MDICHWTEHTWTWNHGAGQQPCKWVNARSLPGASSLTRDLTVCPDVLRVHHVLAISSSRLRQLSFPGGWRPGRHPRQGRLRTSCCRTARGLLSKIQPKKKRWDNEIRHLRTYLQSLVSLDVMHLRHVHVILPAGAQLVSAGIFDVQVARSSTRCSSHEFAVIYRRVSHRDWKRC